MTHDLESFSALFRELGAREPELWARSHLKNGDQLHRYLFLRQAWRGVVADGDTDWIDSEIGYSMNHPGEPYSGVGEALQALLAVGADRRLLTDLVRGMQASLLFGLCYLLEDPGIDEPEVAHVGWRLVQTDEEGEPTDAPICSLHESVLETDPTGREMRPRKSGE